MLFKISFVGKDDSTRPVDIYFVEAKDANQGVKKAQKKAEEEYPFEKPITITSVETVSRSSVIR